MHSTAGEDIGVTSLSLIAIPMQGYLLLGRGRYRQSGPVPSLQRPQAALPVAGGRGVVRKQRAYTEKQA
jgi:hypothetical protein